jgi:hypothetical protein
LQALELVHNGIRVRKTPPALDLQFSRTVHFYRLYRLDHFPSV